MKQNVNPIAATVVVLMTIGVASFMFYWLNRDRPIPEKFVAPNMGRAFGESMEKAAADKKGGPAVKPPAAKPEAEGLAAGCGAGGVGFGASGNFSLKTMAAIPPTKPARAVAT